MGTKHTPPRKKIVSIPINFTICNLFYDIAIIAITCQLPYINLIMSACIQFKIHFICNWTITTQNAKREIGWDTYLYFNIFHLFSECDCGEKYSCTFGWLGKKCICPVGYSDVGGLCTGK